MSKKFGFDRLSADYLAFKAAELEYVRTRAPGDSEIEKLFWVALWARVSQGNCEISGILHAADPAHAARMKTHSVSTGYIITQSQVQLDNWRVDFVISAQAYSGAADQSVWKDAIVECDGHDFHERTKEQAARDRKRDRGMALEGKTLFRFTGSELFRDPMACIDEIIEWASRGAE